VLATLTYKYPTLLLSLPQ